MATVAVLLTANLILVFLDSITGPLLPFTLFYIALLYFAMTRVGSTWAYLIAVISAAGRTYTVTQGFNLGGNLPLVVWQFATSFSVFALMCYLLDLRSSRFSFNRNDPRGRAEKAESGESGTADRRGSKDARRNSSATDKYVPILILASLGFLAAFVPWIHHSQTPDLYCVDQNTTTIVRNPKTAIPTAADVAARTKPLLLTIDDAPRVAEIDGAILDTLNRHLAKAIWFVNCKGFDPAISTDADKNAQMLQRLVQSGQLIGNHSYNHLNLKILDLTDHPKMVREIVQCSSAIQAAIGFRPVYFRAPFGDFTPEIIETAKSDGMASMRWTDGFDGLFHFRHQESADAQLQLSDATLDQFVDSMQAGDIVLLHDSRGTADNFDRFLTKAERRGFTFVIPGQNFPTDSLKAATPRTEDTHND